MNKLLLSLLLLCTAISGFATDYTLVVSMKSGQSESFVLAEKPTIKFTTSGMLINSESAVAAYDRDAVEKFYFVEGTTAVETVKDSNFSFTFVDGENVIITGASGEVRVYGSNGQLVHRHTVAGSGANISLADMEKGIYLININNRTIKIIKK